MAFDTKTSEHKEHATFSASGAERWLNCPGSIALSEGAPEQRESEYAKEGTEAHACLEFMLKNHVIKDLPLDDILEEAGMTYSLDMIEHATFAMNWVKDQLVLYPGSKLLCETRVDSSPFTCADQFGTLDIGIAQEFGRLIIADYKYGAGYAVEPEGEDGQGNPQLVYYGLGISHEYSHNFADAELVVIQPRAYHDSGEVIRSHVMSMADLLAWEELFRHGVCRAKSKQAWLKSGSWCKWCPAATICPELKNKALKQAQIVFDDETGVESVPEPRSIKLPNLSTILSACDRLEDWIGKVREHAMHVLECGETIDGFKLVAKRGTRKWVDEQEISAEARGEFGDLAFTTPELLSPAQLEKAAKSVKGIDEWVSARVTTKSSGTTLVRDTDKRPAISFKTAAEIFAEPPVVLQGRLPPVKKKGK